MGYSLFGSIPYFLFFVGGDFLAKPLLSKIPVFDATIGTNINFSCYGEINKIYYSLYDNENNNEIFKTEFDVESGATRSFSLDISSLTNRASPYYIKVKVKIKSSEEYGELSDPVLFYCHQKPTLRFEDLNESTINEINTSSYRFNLIFSYIEEQGENLNSYQYHLYDSNKKLLDESKTFYDEINNMYSVDGLDAGNIYYIRGTGETINGYFLDTGYIELSINYSVDKNTILLEVKNNYKEGTIEVVNNIVSIDGETSNEITFEERNNGNIVVVLDEGEKITYKIPNTTNLYIFSNYCIRIILKFAPLKNIIEIKTKSDTKDDDIFVSLIKRKFTDLVEDLNEKGYATLRYDGFYTYSNYLNISEMSEYIELDILHKDGIYQLSIKNT